MDEIIVQVHKSQTETYAHLESGEHTPRSIKVSIKTIIKTTLKGAMGHTHMSPFLFPQRRAHRHVTTNLSEPQAHWD